MFGKPSPVTRLAIGTMAGLAFGLAGFLIIPYALPDAGKAMRWGFLLWNATLDAMVGLASVCESQSVLDLPLPWWLLGPERGGRMNFAPTLLIDDDLAAFGAALFGGESLLASPFWAVAEGMAAGLVTGFCASRPRARAGNLGSSIVPGLC